MGVSIQAATPFMRLPHLQGKGSSPKQLITSLLVQHDVFVGHIQVLSLLHTDQLGLYMIFYTCASASVLSLCVDINSLKVDNSLAPTVSPVD